MRELWQWLVKKLEEAYNPKQTFFVSREHLVDINASATRNYWFDKKGNRWPLRDSL